ncbi:MAG: hypothetical protein ACXVRN_07795 [Solirubrobacteraceae bacterium]
MDFGRELGRRLTHWRGMRRGTEVLSAVEIARRGAEFFADQG